MAIEKFIIRQNDLLLPIDYICRGSTGVVDLTGCTVRFRMVDMITKIVKVDASATIVDALTGAVRYSWQLGDTDTSGVFDAFWVVSFPGSRPLTFPNNPENALRIHIPPSY
jgi:hypothetical protein